MNLDAYLKIAGDLHQMFFDDVHVSVVDTEKVLFVHHTPELKVKVSAGDHLPKGGITETCIHTGQRVVKKVPKEVLGVSYVGIGYPIREEDGTISGALVVNVPTDKYDALVNAGQEILAAVEEVSSSADSLSASSQSLAAMVKSMTTETSRVIAEVQHTGTVTQKIHKISNQSNILGLNASIEAARAGSHGLGFSVVADEVRKLADSTRTSTQEIEKDIQAVQESVNTLVQAVHQLGAVTESQAMAATELTNALSQIASMAEHLIEMGKEQDTP